MVKLIMKTEKMWKLPKYNNRKYKTKNIEGITKEYC